MKNIILILILFASTVGIKAQTVRPIEHYFQFNNQDNTYFKDVNNHYSKFLGNWEASTGPHYIKIKIIKAPKIEQGVSSSGRRMMKIKRYIDQIVVECIYKYNNVTVYNTIDRDLRDNGPSHLCVGQILNDPNQIFLTYFEPHTGCGRNRTASLDLTYLSGAMPQLQWT
ncbi:MAG TPA: DUF6705 family protein, partial [Flavobacterium sp.]|nr:DUF6705 family protein [Flavobacterium sp.]